MPVPEYFEFQDRTKIIFGVDTLNEVGREAKKLGAARVFIVAWDMAQKMGHIERIMDAVKKQGIEIAGFFDEIPENSEVSVVEKGYQMATDAGADFIVTIGGGSTIDTAKCINLLLSEGGDLMKDYQGANLINRPLKPFIAIPTTAGTGSEVTFAAVILNSAENMKIAFYSPYLAPTTAILDPKLTVSMPPRLTAATGMDALTHAIEAVHTTTREPISNALALYATRVICENIQEATNNGTNLEARANMLVGSTIAGIAFTNAMVGVVHALAHSAGGVSHVPHGIANAIFLPYGM
ncbi:MAG: iron-containing alcohol dehydrogenase, partial [bacterium]